VLHVSLVLLLPIVCFGLFVGVIFLDSYSMKLSLLNMQIKVKAVEKIADCIFCCKRVLH